MGDLPGFGGIWRTLVGEWEKNLISFIFVFGLMDGDRARWEIYLVSEECGGRWWDSGKKNLIIFIFVFVFVFLFRSVFGFEDGGGRGITGERRSGRGGGGVEDESRRVHDDRGWSRTIGDGLRGRGRSRTV